MSLYKSLAGLILTALARSTVANPVAAYGTLTYESPITTTDFCDAITATTSYITITPSLTATLTETITNVITISTSASYPDPESSSTTLSEPVSYSAPHSIPISYNISSYRVPGYSVPGYSFSGYNFSSATSVQISNSTTTIPVVTVYTTFITYPGYSVSQTGYITSLASSTNLSGGSTSTLPTYGASSTALDGATSTECPHEYDSTLTRTTTLTSTILETVYLTPSATISTSSSSNSASIKTAQYGYGQRV